MSSIILGSLFLLIAFFAYASDVMFLSELIPFALLLFPVYLYARKKKVLNVFFSVGLIFAGARFYMNYLLHTKHPDIVLLPISIDQPIVKQFTGMTVIVALFIWYTYILYAAIISIKERCDKVVTYEELMSDKQILHFVNLFKSTTVLVFLEIVIFTWMYDLTSVVSRMIVFLTIIALMAVCFLILVNKIETDKKILLFGDLNNFMKDVNSRYKKEDVTEEQETDFVYIEEDSED